MTDSQRSMRRAAGQGVRVATAGAALVGGLALSLSLTSSLTLTGCTRTQEQRTVVSRYPELPPKEVPAYLRGTILERVDLAHTEFVQVSGYGLVVNLDGTGDASAPNLIRQFILDELVRYGYGRRDSAGQRTISPEQILADPRTAIVRVDGFIPPGAARGDRFDVQVSALATGQAGSLAGGQLWRTNLKPPLPTANDPDGFVDIGSTVGTLARATGSVFVNPALALNGDEITPTAAESLRSGIVMDGAVVLADRPLALRLRQPSRGMARAIEGRLRERFGNFGIASARDEGLVYCRVPTPYRGDWEHAAQVVLHTYLTNDPAFVARRARELAEEAVKPDALLENISYAWEALGPASLPFVAPLLDGSYGPDVTYAAARAAAFLGDSAAQAALVAIARQTNHAFRLNAVQTLSALRPTPATDALLRSLLSDHEASVRVAAYRGLVRNGDPSIISHQIGEKFMLDVIDAGGPPLVYASRRGTPRVAVFGLRASVRTPLTFAAMDDRLTITADDPAGPLTIFHRPRDVSTPLLVKSNADLAELIARLGGLGAEGQPTLELNYGQIVAILQQLGDSRRIVMASVGTHAGTAGTPSGTHEVASFVLQDLGGAAATLSVQTRRGDGGRPTGGEGVRDDPSQQFIPPSELPRQGGEQGPVTPAEEFDGPVDAVGPALGLAPSGFGRL